MTTEDIIISAVKAMRATSSQNRPPRGYKVIKGKATRYEAQIGIGKHKIYLGLFNTPEEATAAYTAAKARIAELRAQQE